MFRRESLQIGRHKSKAIFLSTTFYLTCKYPNFSTLLSFSHKSAQTNPDFKCKNPMFHGYVGQIYKLQYRTWHIHIVVIFMNYDIEYVISACKHTGLSSDLSFCQAKCKPNPKSKTGIWDAIVASDKRTNYSIQHTLGLLTWTCCEKVLF